MDPHGNWKNLAHVWEVLGCKPEINVKCRLFALTRLSVCGGITIHLGNFYLSIAGTIGRNPLLAVAQDVADGLLRLRSIREMEEAADRVVEAAYSLKRIELGRAVTQTLTVRGEQARRTQDEATTARAGLVLPGISPLGAQPVIKVDRVSTVPRRSSDMFGTSAWLAPSHFGSHTWRHESLTISWLPVIPAASSWAWRGSRIWSQALRMITVGHRIAARSGRRSTRGMLAKASCQQVGGAALHLSG